MSKNKIKVEFHVHSEASKESTNSYTKIINSCAKNGTDCLIVCDHDEIKGAVYLQKAAPFNVVIGEEIASKDGEVIGLFLTKKINPGLSLKETIQKIKDQGGLVCVPHPCDKVRRKKITQKALLENIQDVDIIEVKNSRTIFSGYNQKAKEIAEKYKKHIIVGSDAHIPFELGRTFCEMDSFKDAKEFLASLKKANFNFKKSPLFVHSVTFVKKRLGRING